MKRKRGALEFRGRLLGKLQFRGRHGVPTV